MADTLALVFGDASAAQRLSGQEGGVAVSGFVSQPAAPAVPGTQQRQLVYVAGHPVAAPQVKFR